MKYNPQKIFKHSLVLLTLCCFTSNITIALNANKTKQNANQAIRIGARVDILKAYRDAVHNDPTYQEQVAAYSASKEATPQAVSLLLPQVQINGSLEGTHEKGDISGSDSYNTSSWGANVSQTIFNLAIFQDLSRARYAVRSAALQLSSQQQDLVVRLARAYLAVLEAKDLLGYTQTQYTVLKRTLAATEERYKQKYATITDVEIARGSYHTVSSQLVATKINLHNAIQNLSQITGVRYKNFAQLRNGKFPLVSPNPNNVNQWINKARWDNLSLQAARMNMQAARKNISAAKGNLLPVISGNASWNKTNGFSEEPTSDGNQVRQRAQVSTYGLNATWDLFQGGLTLSQIREAEANYQQAIAQMHQRYLSAVVSARNAFVSVRDGVQQVKRSLSALRANQQALRYSEEAYRAGTLTIFDVLEAQSRLFSAERQYVADLYTYIINNLVLEQAAGTLTPNSLIQINRWLYPKVTQVATFKNQSDVRAAGKPIVLPHPSQ